MSPFLDDEHFVHPSVLHARHLQYPQWSSSVHQGSQRSTSKSSGLEEWHALGEAIAYCARPMKMRSIGCRILRTSIETERERGDREEMTTEHRVAGKEVGVATTAGYFVCGKYK